jgi:hypothetical protein
MNNDIKELLNSWQYEPENNIRITQGDDGREILQIRLPLGIEQYELTGRPDSARPFGKESLLEEYTNRLENAKKEQIKFSLKKNDFTELHGEAIIYYYRYLILFQIGDYQRTITDTERNLEICALVDEHYHGKDKDALLQYKPYIIRINAISKAMVLIKNKKANTAIELLRDTIKNINNLDYPNTDAFNVEKKRSLNHLDEILKQLQTQYPDEKQTLENELKKAVELEDFKQAAILRDRLNELNKDKNENIQKIQNGESNE